MKNNLVFGIIVGVLLSFGLDVIAENIITANQVTYNDSTVETELDSLFDAVDINERLGDTSKISNIGDGTVSGAINTINNNVNNMFLNRSYYLEQGYGSLNIHFNGISHYGNFGLLCNVGGDLYYVLIEPSLLANTAGVRTGVVVHPIAQKLENNVYFDAINEGTHIRLKISIVENGGGNPINILQFREGEVSYVAQAVNT